MNIKALGNVYPVMENLLTFHTGFAAQNIYKLQTFNVTLMVILIHISIPNSLNKSPYKSSAAGSFRFILAWHKINGKLWML